MSAVTRQNRPDTVVDQPPAKRSKREPHPLERLPEPALERIFCYLPRSDGSSLLRITKVMRQSPYSVEMFCRYANHFPPISKKPEQSWQDALTTARFQSLTCTRLSLRRLIEQVFKDLESVRLLGLVDGKVLVEAMTEDLEGRCVVDLKRGGVRQIGRNFRRYLDHGYEFSCWGHSQGQFVTLTISENAWSAYSAAQQEMLYAIDRDPSDAWDEVTIQEDALITCSPRGITHWDLLTGSLTKQILVPLDDELPPLMCHGGYLGWCDETTKKIEMYHLDSGEKSEYIHSLKRFLPSLMLSFGDTFVSTPRFSGMEVLFFYRGRSEATPAPFQRMFFSYPEPAKILGLPEGKLVISPRGGDLELWDVRPSPAKQLWKRTRDSSCTVTAMQVEGDWLIVAFRMFGDMRSYQVRRIDSGEVWVYDIHSGEPLFGPVLIDRDWARSIEVAGTSIVIELKKDIEVLKPGSFPSIDTA